MIDWTPILGNHNVEVNKKQAIAAYDEMIAANVGEALAIETIRQVYAKPFLVSGELATLVKQAIDAVSMPVERAVLQDFEKRIVPVFKVDNTFGVADDVAVPDKKQP